MQSQQQAWIRLQQRLHQRPTSVAFSSLLFRDVVKDLRFMDKDNDLGLEDKDKYKELKSEDKDKDKDFCP